MKHWPQVTIILLLLIGAVIFTWQVAKRVFHITHRLEKTEEKCEKIDDHILPELKNIGNNIHTLNTSFKSLVIHLKAKDITFDAQLFMTKSPLRLTEFGWEILKKVDGDGYIEQNKEMLLKEMDKMGVKTALDSQIMAPIVISNISSNDNFKHIKDYIYNNPVFKSPELRDNDNNPLTINLDMARIAQLMGVYLRDVYLSQHPELNPEDIP